ncbi:MAG: DUF6261 family protein [Azoarcus sp.]|jgi:hypothetical protein|nr:DUF6261 family protein [Azoarcus sp.]
MPSSINPYKNIVRRLVLAENIEFHAVAVQQIETPAQSIPLLASAFEAYRSSFAVLEEEYGRGNKSAETRELALLDERRDALLAHLFRRIDFHAKYPLDDAERNAAEDLQFIADIYRYAANESYEAETAQIRNFILDLSAHGTELAALELVRLIERLHADNEAFAARHTDRLIALQGQHERGAFSALLGKVNRQFDALCQIVNALLLTQQDAATQTALEAIASLVNALLPPYSALLNRHAATRAARKKAQKPDGDGQQSAA